MEGTGASAAGSSGHPEEAPHRGIAERNDPAAVAGAAGVDPDRACGAEEAETARRSPGEAISPACPSGKPSMTVVRLPGQTTRHMPPLGDLQ